MNGWPPISVVIPTYGRAEILAATLRACLDLEYEQFEIIVVDDGSPQDLALALREAFKDHPRRERLRLLRCPRNRGPGAARNAGIRAARHEIVALTDSDCRPQKDWLTVIDAAFADESLHMLTGVVREPPPRNYLEWLCYALNFQGTRSKPVRKTFGGNMAGRRSVLLAHPFREAIFYGGEDVDVGLRASAAGLRVQYVEPACVYHHHFFFRGFRGVARARFLQYYSDSRVRQVTRLAPLTVKNALAGLFFLLAVTAAGAAAWGGAVAWPALLGAACALGALWLAAILYDDLALTGRGAKSLPRALYLLPGKLILEAVQAAGHWAGFVRFWGPWGRSELRSLREFAGQAVPAGSASPGPEREIALFAPRTEEVR